MFLPVLVLAVKELAVKGEILFFSLVILSLCHRLYRVIFLILSIFRSGLLLLLFVVGYVFCNIT